MSTSPTDGSPPVREGSPASGDEPRRATSRALFERARKVIPGGVNSPVRAFKSVGGDPPFIARASGAKVWDADGNEYVDYVGSWGPAILGHAREEVVEAIALAAGRGLSFGAPSEGEVLLAEKLTEALPSMAKVRLVSSGTEATMSALRLARGFTGRDKVVKIDGGYHGHADSFLVAAGSGVATLGIPGSAGVTAATARDTRVVAWNDLDAMRAAVEQGDVAAVIVEPVCGNMGCVPPRRGYLAALRELTARHGALLIFDEVMTGFRVAWGGAQQLYGIAPDLTTLGKVIGGGMPLAAYGGRADVMALVAPDGPVYQAGTLSGNPLAVTSGLVTLELLAREGSYARLEAISSALGDGLLAAAKEAGVPLTVNRVGSMLTAFFTDGEVASYADARRSDTARFSRFFAAMLRRGIYLPPSQFEAAFVSLAHTGEDVERTLAAAREALRAS
jgi:glutamate-1-semialdehyde 2,1-aminomutase